jgi:hypothetical protein
MSPQALIERKARIQQETEIQLRQKAASLAARQRKLENEQRTRQTQQEQLKRGAATTQQEHIAREEARQKAAMAPLDRRHTYAAWAHGLGDKDGLRARHPNFAQDPMTSRRPIKAQAATPPPAKDPDSK